MKKLLLLTTALLLHAAVESRTVNYKKANAQALKEYREAIRPGGDTERPFWNVFAQKFLYAPAFDVPAVADARGYLFRLTDDAGHTWQMKAAAPNASLQTIWNDIPGGTRLNLAVFAVGKDGQPHADTLYRRSFFRDIPFRGPYNHPVRPYAEAARKAVCYVHSLKPIQHWKDHQEPDMSYRLNTYVCKIVGSTLANEVMAARFFPDERSVALQMARNIAAFLVSVSQPADAPLAYFPPTYYKGLIASSFGENQDATMTMEALTVAEAMLDLYDETHDEQYKTYALHIAETYCRLQRPDGSFPIKVRYSTGEAVNESNAMLHPILQMAKRLKTQYGIALLDDLSRRAEEWMQRVPMQTFDFTGQFEDVSVLNLRPYENLTNCTAAPYADYLYHNPASTSAMLRDADDLIRMSEDQFVYWDMKPDRNGIRPHNTPCVFEQYKYNMSVDASACNVARAYLAKFERTGDELALAKALALINNVTVVQNAGTGLIPTLWPIRAEADNSIHFWINCLVHSVRTLLLADDLVKKYQIEP